MRRMEMMYVERRDESTIEYALQTQADNSFNFERLGLFPEFLFDKHAVVEIQEWCCE